MRFLEVFKRRVLLTYVSDIPVRADYRWFFVLILMSAVTASSISAFVENVWISLLFGTLTTLVFFACVFIHEFAHAVVARMEGVQVLEIVLHPFGGLARLLHEPETPTQEFRIAIAGPVASFLLSMLFVAMMGLAKASGATVLAPLFFLLFLFNFLLAVFNLFPGYPLDGGRVLRAYLWKSGKDLNEATILTGRCGQIIGAALIAFGLFTALVWNDLFLGFWTTLVGLFLYDAAKGIIAEVHEAENISVAEVMHLPVAVEPDTNLLHFVDNILTVHRQAAFPVAKGRKLYGILLLEDMKEIARNKWRKTAVKKVMRAVTTDHFVEAHAMLADARELMRTNGIGAVSVIDTDGKLVGFLSGGRIKKGKRQLKTL